MSVKVMSWVWDHSQAKGGNLLVLLAIADSADHDGTHAWPAVATLCRKTRLSRRAVQYAVTQLVKLGELEVQRQKGGPLGMRPEARPNAYTVLMAEPVDNSAGVQKLHGGGAKRDTEGVQPTAPNPSFTRPGQGVAASRTPGSPPTSDYEQARTRLRSAP